MKRAVARQPRTRSRRERAARIARGISAASAIACGVATVSACTTPSRSSAAPASVPAAPRRTVPADAAPQPDAIPAPRTEPVHATSSPRARRTAPTNVIIFAKGHALWRIAPRGGAPHKLADLGAAAAKLHRLASNRRGTLLLLGIGDATYTLDLDAGATARLKRLACTGLPRTAADGSGAICLGPHGHTLLYAFGANGRMRSPRDLALKPAAVLGARPPSFLVDRRGKLWRTALGAGPGHLLVPQAPSKHLLVAPNGKRAVGTYRIDELDRLCSFRLDGRAARRRLITEGIPIAWSWNSRWLLVQDGRRGCLVRAVGGEYKCWRRYRAVSLTWNGKRVLLERPDSGRGALRLYTAPLKGALPARPHLVVKGAQGAALWLSARPAGG